MTYEPIPTSLTLEELAAMSARSFNHLSAQVATVQEDVNDLKLRDDRRDRELRLIREEIGGLGTRVDRSFAELGEKFDTLLDVLGRGHEQRLTTLETQVRELHGQR